MIVIEKRRITWVWRNDNLKGMRVRMHCITAGSRCFILTALTRTMSYGAETIINVGKVHTQTQALHERREMATWLAYVERITDAYSQQRGVVPMIENMLKTINSVNRANYHLNKFLSASAWSSL